MLKTYLVTGGAGFIGSNFIQYLLDNSEDIRVVNIDLLTYAGHLENLQSVESDSRYTFIQGNICDSALVGGLFSEYSFDCVVNFAAESHVDLSIIRPAIFVESNVLGTANLLECAKSAWLDNGTWKANTKFIQVSTDEVYGSLGETGYFTEDSPLDPHSPYSASKAGADLLVQAYATTYGMPINITRCSNNYGPQQFPEKLIPLMINNARNHKKLPVYGDGLNVRDWLHVQDHCSALVAVIEKGAPGEVYNIGGHNEQTNIDIVRRIIEILHDVSDSSIDESLIEFTADRLGHDRRYGIDPTKISTQIGWKPEISFNEGIVQTVQWYLGNDSWVSSVMNGSSKQ